MLETLQGDLGCNRLMFLCLLPAGADRSQMLNLAIFHRISSACNSTSALSNLFSIREQNTKVWTVIYIHNRSCKV